MLQTYYQKLSVIEFKSSAPMTNLLPIISYCNHLHQFHDREIYVTNTEAQNLGLLLVFSSPQQGYPGSELNAQPLAYRTYPPT
jgi:hypothetical protein